MIIEKPTYDFWDLKTKTIDGKRYYVTPEDNKFISITTLLGHFKKKSIAQWRKRVGEAEANRITAESSSNGTRMHSGLELYLDGKDHKRYVETKDEKVQFDRVKDHLDKHLQETWYQEVPLYSNQLGVAGRVDLIGVHDNAPAIIDFKTSRKWKKKQWIEDYFMQATFYSMAFYELTNYPIKDIVILISVNKGEDFQVFHEKVGNWMKPLHSKIKEYKDIFHEQKSIDL